MRLVALIVTAVLLAGSTAEIRSQAPATPDRTVLLTIFLKHDQSRTLKELQSQLASTGFYRDFPPAGTEVVSWYVMMGIGQVVTLRVPPERLREVNQYFEQRAWGAFRTEFYPTYDFKQAFRELKEKERQR